MIPVLALALMLLLTVRPALAQQAVAAATPGGGPERAMLVRIVPSAPAAASLLHAHGPAGGPGCNAIEPLTAPAPPPVALDAECPGSLLAFSVSEPSANVLLWEAEAAAVETAGGSGSLVAELTFTRPGRLAFVLHRDWAIDATGSLRAGVAARVPVTETLIDYDFADPEAGTGGEYEVDIRAPMTAQVVLFLRGGRGHLGQGPLLTVTFTPLP